MSSRLPAVAKQLRTNLVFLTTETLEAVPVGLGSWKPWPATLYSREPVMKLLPQMIQKLKLLKPSTWSTQSLFRRALIS